MSRRPATNDNLRDLIDTRFDALRLEMKSDLKDIYNRIDELDKTVSKNALTQAVSSTKLGSLITGITLLGSAITTIIINKITGRIL